MNNVKVKATTEVFSATTEGNGGGSSVEEMLNSLEASDATLGDARLLPKEPMVQIDTIDVACGKQRMTVRISFEDHFNGIIYAKVRVSNHLQN